MTEKKIRWQQTAMRHKKHFLRGPLNCTEFPTNRKKQCRAENAFFLQTEPGKLYESYFLQKPAAPSCSCPVRRDRLISTTSTSQLDMKGKTQRRRSLCFPFSCKEFPGHQRWTAEGEKDKGAKKALSQP